jgi:hypothetical protein
MKSSGTTRHSGPVLSAPLVDASAALFSWVFIEERSRGRSRTGEAFWRFLERVGGWSEWSECVRGGMVCEGRGLRASVGLSVPVTHDRGAMRFGGMARKYI